MTGKERYNALQAQGLCTDCGRNPLADGLQARCEECNTQYLERRLQRHLSDPRKAMVGAAKVRAKKQGVPFDLCVDDITIPECCPVLGLTLEVNAGAKGGANNSPTLDRIIPELGYTKGNVEVISYRANTLKRDGTLKEFIRLTMWLSWQVARRSRLDEDNLKET